MDEGHNINTAERLVVAQTMAALMTAAYHADVMLEGRLREDFIALARNTLAEQGVLNIGTAATEEGPRNVFADGKLLTPDGSEWDLSG